MSALAGSKALLVLGMHRSGTSCLARVVNLLGASLGPTLAPARSDNPLGFWEHAEIARLHEELLHRLGDTWQSARPLPFEWWRRPELDDLRVEARRLLERDFGGESRWALKDPRLCRLLRFWQPILVGLECEVSYLIVTRDPREVAASLLERDGIPWWRSDLLWLRHVLEAEKDTRGGRRAFVRYGDVLAGWRGALEPAAKALDLSLPEAGSPAEAEIHGFVRDDQRHHRPESVRGWPSTPWARTVYEALDPCGGEAAAETEAVCDRISEEVRAADALHAPWRDQLEDDLRDARREVEERAAQLAERTEACATLGRDLDRARTAVAESEGRLDELRRERQRRVEELSAQRDEVLSNLGVSRAESARSRQRVLQLESELADAEHARREAAHRALELEQVVADLDETTARQSRESGARIIALETELGGMRRELDAHRLELQRVLSSRSWRITQPVRTVVDGLRRRRRRPRGLDPMDLAPWEELLPGAPFRQRVRSPIDRLRGLGIVFFTYRRSNRTRVAVRLFEEPHFAGPLRLLSESVLCADEIQDGQMSRVVLAEPIARARRRRLVIEVESLDGSPGETVTVALARRYYRGELLTPGTSSQGRVLAVEFDIRRLDTRKAFAFISGCPGDAYRYRCVHQAEMLSFRGYSVDLLPPDLFPWTKLLTGYQVVVAHRVPHSPEFEDFVAKANERGVEVVFDSDDLVFDPDVVSQIAALDDMDEAERDLYLSGVRRYRASLQICGRVMVSTDGLAKAVEERFDLPVVVSRNRISEEMWQLAVAADAQPREARANLRLGYLSGTRTHKRDFQECVPALARLLDEYPDLRLVLVGHIDPPRELARHRSRIEQLSLVPWQDLPRIYASLDVNLAPLERDNEFTEGKSELKYLEAGLLGVPTVASDVGGYRAAIRDGENGFLCTSEEDWLSALRRIVADGSLRSEIGERAREDVQSRYRTRSAAAEYVETWQRLLDREREPSPKLSVAFVLRAPIAGTGGGYKKIFQLVSHLSRRGHSVHVYVEAIAHLAHLSEDAIRRFCEENFDCGGASIHVGHDEIAGCDVAVATNWPTVAVVDDLTNARLRLYFVQDYETEFYTEEDPLRAAAEASYDRRLLVVGIGRYLSKRLEERNGQPYPHIDFALASEFFEGRDEVEEKLSGPARSGPPSVLFFARPEIPRRGFELGVEALRLLHEACPEVSIRLYGMGDTRRLGFPYENLGVLGQGEVAREMRRAAMHLSFSRTNASTVLFEAMASGCAAVDLDEPGVSTLVEDPASCVLVEPSAEAVAAALIELARDSGRIARVGRAGVAATSHLGVENMCEQFEALLLRYSLARRLDGPPLMQQQAAPEPRIASAPLPESSAD